jgi:hypothetical protein
MRKTESKADLLVNMWVDNLLQSPDKLLALPLSNDLKSPWGVNVLADFLSKETSITISEAQRRKHLTMPLIEKMARMRIIVKEASSRENLIRQRILHWYNTLSLEDKKHLPRSTLYPNNICFRSIGTKQRSWISLATQHEWIATIIDEIHEDLHKLGIIEANFKTVNKRKRLIKDVKSAVLEWVSTIIDDIDALWEIPISKANTPLGFNVAIEYIQTVIGISESSANKHRELVTPLIERMIEKEIILHPQKCTNAVAIESRRMLLSWYRKLSNEEKKLLPLFGNQLSLKRMTKPPITRSDLRLSAVKDAWHFIHRDLEQLGLTSANYKSVRERTAENDLHQIGSKENKKERFNRLSKIKLNNFTDFINPSEEEPFIQIEQLFASKSNTVTSESAKSNYQITCVNFVDFLHDYYGNKPFLIKEAFDKHMLSRYRKYLEQKIILKKITSYYANSLLSCVRSTLVRLTQVTDLNYVFFNTIGFDATRETDIKKPFTKNERLQILKAIEMSLSESKSSLVPYKKTGIGRNPLDKEGNRIRGLSTLENAQWLYENPLKCTPVHHNTAISIIEKNFLKIISDSDKGLIEVYNEWGVIPMISIDILLPYFLKLAQITGLNTESLLSLNIDDYVPCHPATSRPCLRYWKERSDGHKEYHLDLFKAELTWLTSTQSKSIKTIFEEVIQLTSSFRHKIEDDKVKNRLFIYESASTKNHGRVAPLFGSTGKNEKGLGESLARFVNKYSLKDDMGEPLTLTISRFRPTFVSEMIDNGISLREVQLMLGHSSIRTTIKYLDSLDFNSISRAKLNKKLKEIHKSTLQEKVITLPKNTPPPNDEKLLITFNTPLAACKNIFAPPDFVKLLPSYTPGTPCSQYNKCLSCDNVIITVKNLPEIFAMHRDYIHLTERTRVMDTPYGHVINENLSLIQHIIDPKLSEFSAEDLENGKRLAEYIETTILIDGVIQ